MPLSRGPKIDFLGMGRVFSPLMLCDRFISDLVSSSDKYVILFLIFTLEKGGVIPYVWWV